MRKLKFIDLFIGAGGLSKGFEMAGFKPVFAVEFNSTYAKSYLLNNPDVEMFYGDIHTITDEQIKKIRSKHKIVVLWVP